MDKKLVLLTIMISIGFGSVYALPTYDLGTSNTNPIITGNSIDWSKCNPHCIEMVPNHNGRTTSQANQPQQFDIFMPDGACNAYGTIQQPSGTCSSPKIVLGPVDYIQLQNDPGVFAVINLAPTNLPQNIDYCVLANFTWVHQDAAFQTKYNMTLVIPDYCLHNHVISIPEFPMISALVLVIAIATIVIVPTRFK